MDQPTAIALLAHARDDLLLARRSLAAGTIGASLEDLSEKADQLAKLVDHYAKLIEATRAPRR